MLLAGKFGYKVILTLNTGSATAILFWFRRFSLPEFSFEYVSTMCIQFRTNSGQVGIGWNWIKIMLNNGLYHNKSVFVYLNIFQSKTSNF